jgi:xanthine dehydrogenase small subunit
MRILRFWLNDRLVEEDCVPPTTTLLNYVRSRGLTGTKEGCAEGDCGACTVAVVDALAAGGPVFRAVNSCLLLLPMLQGKRVYTVEALDAGGALHAAQEAVVRRLASQCGYCTPGVVMSLFEACYRSEIEERWQIDDQLCGNLCRCTGYRPIRDAAKDVAGTCPADRFSLALGSARAEPMDLSYERGPQRYFNPGSLNAFFVRLLEHPEAKLICGGTDVSLSVTKRFEALPLVISLEGIAELRAIRREAGGMTLGATAPLSEVHDAVRADFPALDKMLRVFASRQIKNRATLGGNLCSASPIGDLAPVLLALGARVRLLSRRGERELPLDELFLGYRKTALAPGEILASVFVPNLPNNAKATSFKVAKRRELDISAVSAGCYVELDPSGEVAVARLAFGGMAPTPARARSVEAALLSRPWSEESIEAVVPLIDHDFKPVSDHRGSAWYRSVVAKNLIRGFYFESSGRVGPQPSAQPTATVHPRA